MKNDIQVFVSKQSWDLARAGSAAGSGAMTECAAETHNVGHCGQPESSADTETNTGLDTHADKLSCAEVEKFNINL